MFFDTVIIVLLVLLVYGVWCAVGTLDAIQGLLENQSCGNCNCGTDCAQHPEEQVRETDFDPFE